MKLFEVVYQTDNSEGILIIASESKQSIIDCDLLLDENLFDLLYLRYQYSFNEDGIGRLKTLSLYDSKIFVNTLLNGYNAYIKNKTFLLKIFYFFQYVIVFHILFFFYF